MKAKSKPEIRYPRKVLRIFVLSGLSRVFPIGLRIPYLLLTRDSQQHRVRRSFLLTLFLGYSVEGAFASRKYFSALARAASAEDGRSFARRDFRRLFPVAVSVFSASKKAVISRCKPTMPVFSLKTCFLAFFE